MKIILASQSPRRRELLKLVTPEFEVIPSQLDESSVPVEPVDYYAERLARAKALEIVQKCPEDVVIGCDTVVLLAERILGKPKNREEALEMLHFLSGRTHKVITGVSLMRGQRAVSFSQVTEVEFFNLTDREIDAYIATGEPFDKAGGYGIQEYGSLLVEEIRGDFFNVVGLPVARLKKELDVFMNIQ